MEEMRVFIVNLEKYNEGESVGAWFNLPIDFENVKEKIGLDATHKKYAILDYKFPDKIWEHASIEEINRMAEIVEELQNTPIANVISEILAAGYYEDIYHLLENVGHIACYPNCNSMEELAHYLIDECGALGEISDSVRRYINYEAYARDIEIERKYVVTKHGVFKLAQC